nr:ankyrin repeat/F-box domain-containing protein [Oceanusvirus sp.]
MLSMTCRGFRKEFYDRNIDASKYIDTFERYLSCIRMGCDLTAGLSRHLMRLGNDQGLLHARSLECPLDHTVMAEAARAGRMDVLLWGSRNGAGLHADVMDAAAAGGHPHVMRWLHENGCPMRATTCAEAAGGAGSAACLREIVRLRGRLEGATEATIAAELSDNAETARWITENHDVDMAKVRYFFTVQGVRI